MVLSSGRRKWEGKIPYRAGIDSWLGRDTDRFL